MSTPEWFVGCWADESTSNLAPIGSAQIIFDGDRCLWANHAMRVVAAAGWRIAISGVCAAPDHSLERLVARIVGGLDRIEALCRFAGSYHVVVDDGRMLTALGDLAGVRQLFAARIGGSVVFASSPQPLAAMARCSADVRWLTASLFCPDALELHERSTAHAGIARIPPGWLLRCGRDGADSVKRADDAFDRRPPAQAARALGDALEHSVAIRCGDEVSADLSGGLDSTSLAVLAARHGSISTITYADPLACADEDVVFALRIAANYAGMRHTLISGDAGTLPYAGIDPAQIAVFDEPSQDILIAARTRARMAPAVDCTAHLVGDGGDVVLTGPLVYVSELVRTWRFGALAREVSGLARLRQRPATSVAAAALRCATSTYGRDLRRCAQRLDTAARGRMGPWRRPEVEAGFAWARVSAAAAWATASAARELAERLRALESDGVPELGADDVALRRVRWHGALTRNTQRLASCWGVRLHAPFLDDAVLAACASVQVVERTTVDAAKPLLGLALSGRVPSEVLTRRSKGDYTASEYAGLRAAAPRIRRLLKDPLLADLGLIEPDQVTAAVLDAVDGRAAPLGAIADVIATELWLRATHDAELSFWTPQGALQ